MKMNPVVHFELPADDSKRMSEFYQKVFGWKTEMMGPEMGNYVVASTTEGDEKGHPKMPGTINGGFYTRDKSQSQYPSVVISVDNIREHMEKVKSAGGQVLGEPMDIPKVGQFVSFMDTEGNRLSILQPSPEM